MLQDFKLHLQDVTALYLFWSNYISWLYILKLFFYFIDHFLSFELDEHIANIFDLWIINENEILRQHKVLLSVDPKLRFWIKKSDLLWVYCTSGMDEVDELTPFLFQIPL